MVKLHTSLGTITIKLDAEKAPKTVENFLAYVEAGHYDNTIFHRVIPNFMIQGGGFDLMSVLTSLVAGGVGGGVLGGLIPGKKG